MKKRSTLFIALTVLLVAVATYFYFSAGSSTQQVFYLTEPVKKASIDKTVLATGSVRAFQRIEVGAQVSGKIEKIHVKLGQQVKQGDLLAEIDASNLKNSLSSAQAELTAYQLQLKAKEVALAVAESSYQRLSKLYKQRSASLDDLETAQNNLALAKANLEEINAQIKIAEIAVSDAQTNLDYARIVSPIDGVVVSLPISAGQTVNSSQSSPTIVQVADLSKMLIKLEIAEGDISQIKVGQNVTFTTLADPNHTYNGQIGTIDPALTTLTDDSYTEESGNSDAVYYYANVVVDNDNQQLRIGMTTQSRVTIAQRDDVLVVPTSALKMRGQKAFINVLENDKSVEKEIQIGLADGINTEVTEGLTEGEKVITTERAASEQVGSQMRMPRF